MHISADIAHELRQRDRSRQSAWRMYVYRISVIVGSLQHLAMSGFWQLGKIQQIQEKQIVWRQV